MNDGEVKEEQVNGRSELEILGVAIAFRRTMSKERIPATIASHHANRKQIGMFTSVHVQEYMGRKSRKFEVNDWMGVNKTPD